MSANNWRICPQCRVSEQKRQDVAMKKAADAYGKVEAAKYDALLKDTVARELDSDLREDWEILMGDDGEFRVRYRCSCDTCDFEFGFQHKVKASLK